MIDREKIAELIADYFGVDPAYYGVDAYAVADHLLSNGVTFVTDNNVGSNWIPVTMRRPDLELVEARAEDFDLFPCLVVNTSPLTPRKRYVTKAWYDGVGFMDTDCVRITPTVTHWSPLPELPKEGT